MTSSPAVTMALALGVSSLVSVASERIRIPALMPLLIVGLLLGRSGVGAVDASSLGPLLSPLITIGIGLLVFEGALHLTWRELSKAPRAVGGLLTISALVTWMLASVCAMVILGFGVSGSILFGAMLTVTGPTVVQPILRRVRVTSRLRAALSAEAVLIDPIGVLLTIVVLTTLKAAAITPVSASMFLDGARRLGFQISIGVGVGLGVGLVSLFLGRSLSEKGRIHPQILNILAVGTCMLAIGLGEFVTPEAGLVAAAVSAICLGSLKMIGVAELHAFKQQLAALTVGSLFILLASRFEIRTLGDAGVAEGIFVAAIIFLVRPVASALGLLGSRLDARERGFIALFAPRGIVALSVAVIAADDLSKFAAMNGTAPVEGTIVHLERLVADAASFERVMFIVIAGTVCWASIAGPLIARALRVGGGRPSGVLLVGGHRLSIETGAALRSLGVEVTLLDSHYEHVMRATAAGVPVIRGDATDLRWLEDQQCCDDLGLVLAWTGNPDVDFAVGRWASERFGKESSAIWAAGKIPADANWSELGGGRLLHELMDEVDAARWRVDTWNEMNTTAIPFIAVAGGRPRFIVPGEMPPGSEIPKGTTLVGLVRAKTE